MPAWETPSCVGLVKDRNPRSVPPTVWTDCENVRFIDGKTVKRAGQKETLYTFSTALADPSPSNTGNGTVTGIATYSTSVAEVITLVCTAAATNSGTFSVTGSVSGALGSATVGTEFDSPSIGFTITDGATDYIVGDNFTITITKVAPAADIHHLLPWTTTTTSYWVWASLTNIYRWDGSTHSVVTRVGGSPSAAIPYNADADKQWTSTVHGEVVVMNNGVDLPQYLGTSGTEFANFPTGGSNWPTNLRCKALRSFKGYLVALNLSEGATISPQNVRWSTAADPGSLPSWDITDPTLEAGENTLSETDGEVVDGMSLGDSFIIYKEDSVWGMQLIGGQYVMRFYKIFMDRGLLTQNCVGTFNGMHFCVGRDDVYIHNGSTPRSVISGKVRNTLFEQINDTYIDRCYVVADYKNREMLFCYVSSTGSATYPDRALVYNWESDEVSFRTLPGSAHIGFGAVATSTEADQWDSDNESWDSDTSEWGTVDGKPTQGRLVIPDTTGQTFYSEGDLQTDAGTAFYAFVEKLGIDGGDLTVAKHPYRVVPVLEGSGSVTVYIGGEDAPGSGYIWSAPQTFTIGSSKWVDFHLIAGRSLGIRFESEADCSWELSGFTIEGQIGGRFS